jgi:hypothetical protein
MKISQFRTGKYQTLDFLSFLRIDPNPILATIGFADVQIGQATAIHARSFVSMEELKNCCKYAK